MKRRLLAVALLMVAGAVVLIIRLGEKPQEGVLELSGNVEATEVDVGFKTPGRVLEVLTDEGLAVKKGDRLAVLDSAELEREVEGRKAAVAEAEARLRELRAGSRPQEIDKAAAAVASARADLEKARSDLERTKMLHENGAVSRARLDADRRAYEVAAARHESALQELSLLKEGPRAEEIAAQEGRLAQARAALAAAEERLRDSVIYAPLSGVVLRKNVEAGETVAAGVPVLTIGDLENPWIKVYVKEDKLGLVRLGQKAGVTTDSYPGKAYDGTVTRISSEAEFTPKNVQTREERVKLVFGVEVRVQNPEGELKPGMPADVRLEVR
ncbi:MAG: efflux RND transporter periplasmic adaptor subunit [Thermodesulfovibrionales bacterium]